MILGTNVPKAGDEPISASSGKGKRPGALERSQHIWQEKHGFHDKQVGLDLTDSEGYTSLHLRQFLIPSK